MVKGLSGKPIFPTTSAKNFWECNNSIYLKIFLKKLLDNNRFPMINGCLNGAKPKRCTVFGVELEICPDGSPAEKSRRSIGAEVWAENITPF
jgi:hypothetical protein